LLVIRHFGLPIEPLSRLIEERQFDLYNDPMPTKAALEGYVTDTSGAIFALATRIFGPLSAETEQLARHAGLAYGFWQVIVNLPRDASRRQLFLPLQLLQDHGSGLEEVFAGRETPALRAALDQLVAEARLHLRSAFSLLNEVPEKVRPVFLPLVVARRDLERLLRADAAPFAPRTLSRFGTLWSLWRASRSKAF
jgi:15-cis-phytoene synthase